jgi:hypothetical protein
MCVCIWKGGGGQYKIIGQISNYSIIDFEYIFSIVGYSKTKYLFKKHTKIHYNKKKINKIVKTHDLYKP